jgi:hypothetical protein
MSMESERGHPEKSKTNGPNGPFTQTEAAQQMRVSPRSGKRARAQIKGKPSLRRALSYTCQPFLNDFDSSHAKAVAFLQGEPIRSLDHYAIFERSSATAAKLSEVKTPQRKALPVRHSAARHKRTRER